MLFATKATPINYSTSQNTMYCGGEPEHKRLANKCMREEIHPHNNGELY